jgi:regulatory protein
VDAYTTALTLLSRRELSTKQLRDRLARRKFDSREIDSAIERLTHDRTLDDHRVALAWARNEASVRRHGRRRVLQQLLRLGIQADTANDAVAEVFAEIDEAAILDQAIARRLKGGTPDALDDKAVARIVRGLVAQGFAPAQVYARLRPRHSSRKDDE